MSQHKSHINFIITLLAIGWGLLVAVTALRAQWSGPNAQPPGGNPSSFLTSGTNPETKTGPLTINNNFYVTGNTSLGSTATPTSARVVITPYSNSSIDAGNGSIRTTYIPASDYDVVTKTYLASSLSGSSYWLLSTSTNSLYPTSTDWKVAIGTTTAGTGKLVVMGGNVGIGTTSPTANFQVDGSSLFNGLVFINTDPNNSNDSGFEYGNGYNPAVSNYDNQKFRINSFFESPFVSMGVALNYLLRSEAFDNSSWTKTGIGTVSANKAAAPNGRVTAENIPAGSSDTANISQTVTNTTTGYWAAGVWARATGTPTATIKLRLDSSSATGAEVTFNLDNTWRFYSIKQNFTSAHTNKTFRIITGTNTVSLWGARMNPGESVNAYYYTTSSGLTSPYMGVFFNYSNVYASTFSGSLSGNASSANYASGLYGGFSISNDTDKTNQWEYIGYMYLAYSSTYRYGQSWNVELKVKELDRRGTLTPDNYGETTIRMQGKMPAVANSTEFNTTVPTFTVNIDGNGGLSPDDVAMLVYSSDTSAKYIRLYVRLKNPDSHYIFVPINQYGASYSSSGSISNGYCYYTSMGNQAATTNLPTPAQGSIVYATQRFDSSDFWRSNNNDIYNANSGNVGIGTTSPSAKLDVGGTLKVGGAVQFANVLYTGTTSHLLMVDAAGNVSATSTLAGISMPSGTIGQTLRYGSGGWEATSSIYVKDGGNVGIGTINPGQKLEVVGTAGANATPLLISTTGTWSSGQGSGIQFKDSSGEVGHIQVSYDGTKTNLNIGGFYNGGYGSASNQIFTIQGNGNVGIGTATPIYHLDIRGASGIGGNILYVEGNNRSDGSGTLLAFTGSSYNGNLVIKSGSTADANAGINLVNDYTTDRRYSLFIDAADSKKLKINTDTSYSITSFASNNLLVIDSSGSVGIGTTSPAAKLDVNGGGSFTQVVFVPTPTNPGHAVNKDYVDSVASAASSALWVKNGSNLYASSTSWDVGIGTTSPAAKLDVNGSLAVRGSVSFTGPLYIGSNRLLMVDSSGNVTATSTQAGISMPSGTAGQTLRYGSGGWEATSTIYVKDGGNVGIGTTNPQAKLDVRGNIYLSNEVPFAGAGYFNAQKEQYATATVPEAGWYRVAHIDGSDGRGQNTVTVYTTGGSYAPRSTSIRWFNDWGSYSGINAISELGTSGWNQARVTREGSNSYLEVYFTQAINNLSLSMQYDGGFVRGVLYEGTLVAGGGTVQASIPLGLLAVGDKFIIDSSGKVGIGTTSPSVPLAVNGYAIANPPTASGHLATKGYVDSSIQNLWVNSGSNLYASSTSWNVGIGTTSPADKLQVYGNTFLGKISGYPFKSLWTWDSDNSGYYAGIGYQKTDGTNQKLFTWWKDNVLETNINSVLNVATITNTFNGVAPNTGRTIGVSLSASGNSYFNAGNVGIGTTSPGYKLDVNGGARFSGTVQVATPAAVSDAATKGYVDSAVAATSTALWTLNGSNLYASSTSWNVGIGTTNPGTAKLAVMGGNMGIGTTNPKGLLQIDSSTSDPLKLRVHTELGSANSLAGIAFGVDTGNQYMKSAIALQRKNSNGQGDLVFMVDSNSDGSNVDINDEKLRIQGSSGNVGIGTTSPSYKLDVNGGGSFTQFVFVPTPTADGHAVNKAYVNSVFSSTTANYVLKTGDTMTGTLEFATSTQVYTAINLNGNNISAVHKLGVVVIDPLYDIGGTKYSSYAPSVVGGVKEEHIGKGTIKDCNHNVCSWVLDFSKVAKGSDLWVWRQIVDFRPETIDVLMTAYGRPASLSYEIGDNQIIFYADHPTQFSYRLVGSRFDWRQWPTLALDQSEPTSLIVP